MTNMLENHASPSSVVSEEVLKATTSENPDTRYTVSEDAKMMEKQERQCQIRTLKI